MLGAFRHWSNLPISLRWRWGVVGLVGGGLLLAASLAVSEAWLPASAWWLTSIVWLYFWFFAGWHLDRHRVGQDRRLAARLGAGNTLTLGRGWLLAVLAGFLLAPPPPNFGRWLPMLAYTTADIADYIDGYLARRQGLSSQLGEALDMELDSLGLLLAVAVAIHFGALPSWFLVFGLARYGYTTLLRLRRAFNRPVYELPDSKARRPIAGLSMGYVSATLWPILDRPELTLAGVIFLTPFLASFIRDGMVAAGQLDPEHPAYRRWRRLLRAALLKWLPLALRAGLVIALTLEIARLLDSSQSLALFEFGRWVGILFALMLLGTGLAMVLGWAGRFMAFAAVFPMGLTIATDSLDPVRALLVVCVLGILILGTGQGSLWKPSDQIFAQRAGEAALEGS